MPINVSQNSFYKIGQDGSKVPIPCFQGEKGQKGQRGQSGQDGRTPIKGQDYFTQQDKTQFVDAVKSELQPSLTQVSNQIVNQGNTISALERDALKGSVDLSKGEEIPKGGGSVANEYRLKETIELSEDADVITLGGFLADKEHIYVMRFKASTKAVTCSIGFASGAFQLFRGYLPSNADNTVIVTISKESMCYKIDVARYGNNGYYNGASPNSATVNTSYFFPSATYNDGDTLYISTTNASAPFANGSVIYVYTR